MLGLASDAAAKNRWSTGICPEMREFALDCLKGAREVNEPTDKDSYTTRSSARHCFCGAGFCAKSVPIHFWKTEIQKLPRDRRSWESVRTMDKATTANSDGWV
jgi:hypothetical protein